MVLAERRKERHREWYRPEDRESMKHEERHAVGMWLVAAFLGGFAVLVWWAGGLRRDGGEAPPPPSIERSDSVA